MPRKAAGHWVVSLAIAITLAALAGALGQENRGISVSPGSLTFASTGSTPSKQVITVSARQRTGFTAGASVQSGRTQWLRIEPSGNLATNQEITVSVSPAGLSSGTYRGTVSLAARGTTTSVPVTFQLSVSGGGGGTGGGAGGGTAGYKLIGWNDLGMHCLDGKDYSVFGVLPPYNTIHAHLLDSTGKLITNPAGYSVTYQAINDPLTNTLSATSASKTNFWTYAQTLFGLPAPLAPDMGLKGFAMPGPSNTPRAMEFTSSDNTFLAEGIPIMPFTDSGTVNYYPMMRLTAKNSSGGVLATTDIVVPTSDEMTCTVCHSSSSTSAAAKPAGGWVNNPDPAKDVKLNILRRHDDRHKSSALFKSAAAAFGYNPAGLEATVAAKPILCGTCHKTNALGTAGVAGIPQLTTAMHARHTNVIDPATNQSLNSSTSRDSCYRCHPGPKTQCLRGAMATRGMECQSCHGNMSAVAVSTRNGWLDEPNCQSCHTGTARSNAGQIAYTSVFSSGTTVRTVTNMTYATNPNTPSAGLSLYRFSKGHGGLQCEACHGSTHSEYATPIVNDNVQSTKLQGHAGMLAECSACHATVPNTVSGGPHGMHPIGSSWVSRHHDVSRTNCQDCHGTDYRGTILSRMQADRTLAGRTFTKGTIIGCYNCHNGPNP